MITRDVTRRRSAMLLLSLCLVLVAIALVLSVLLIVSDPPLHENAGSATSGLIFIVAGLVYCVVGTVIARRQPGNTIGWVVLLVGTCYSIVLAVSTYVDWAVSTQSQLEPAAWGYALFGWTWAPAVGTMATFVVLLFPDGHLPGPRWRWLAWISAILIVAISALMVIAPNSFDNTALAGIENPLAVELPIRITSDDLFPALLACMVASAVAAVTRYRRADGIERLQLKWLAAASILFASFFVLSTVVAAVLPSVAENAVATEVINHLLPLAFSAFPLAIAAAVLKYHLYEIDVVISRTIVVAVLSAFITAVYVAIVVGVGAFVGRGDEPDLALSLAATAVVAVAFQPVRERVHRWANRLVYGERATPYEVLSQFAERMGGAVDDSRSLPGMARTIGQGIGAARVEVWLQRDTGFERAAGWPAAEAAATTVASLHDLAGNRVVPVRQHDELLGAVTVEMRAGEELAPQQDRLLADVATQAGLVLRNVRLIEDLRSSRQRLVASQDEERRRLERNLHDGAQQSLVALTLMLRMTRSRVTAAETGAALDRAGDELQQAIAELRELARGIYPAVLAERGLGPALTSLAERSAVPVVIEDRVAGRLPEDVERTFYFVAAEALAGAAADGTELIDIRVARPKAAATLEISGVADGEDDLIWLRDRVAVVDGTVTRSGPDGGPLVFTVPVPAGAEPQRASASVMAAGAAS